MPLLLLLLLLVIMTMSDDDDDVVLPKFAATPNIPVAPVVAATTIPGGWGVFVAVRTSFGPLATMTVDALFRIPDDGNGRRVVEESVARVEVEMGGVVGR